MYVPLLQLQSRFFIISALDYKFGSLWFIPHKILKLAPAKCSAVLHLGAFFMGFKKDILFPCNKRVTMDNGTFSRFKCCFLA